MEHHLTTYITHDTLISALGFGTQENLEAIRSYHSGITLQTDKRIADILSSWDAKPLNHFPNRQKQQE